MKTYDVVRYEVEPQSTTSKSQGALFLLYLKKQKKPKKQNVIPL